MRLTLPGELLGDDQLVQATLYAVDTAMPAPADLNGLIGQMEANLKWATEEHAAELAQLAMPCLVVANEFDSCFSLAGRSDMMAVLPDAELVICHGEEHLARMGRSMKLLNTAATEFVATH